MTTRTTIALGAVFAALLTAFILTGRRERAIERREFEAKKVFEFAAQDVASISIQQRGQEVVEAVRAVSGGWEFAGAHRSIPVNAPLLDQLAEVMTMMQNERPIEDAEDDLASFELAPPQLTVLVGTAQGAIHQVELGGLDPTQRNRYLYMPDHGVFLSDAQLFTIMNRTLAELRDRHLFTNLADGMAKFEYTRYLVDGAPGAELSPEVRERMAGIDDAYEQDAEGVWWMTRPVRTRARPDFLDALNRVLPSLGGRAFIDDPEDLADYGLDKPFARMTVYGPEGTGETLLLGGIDDASTAEGEAGLYVKHDNQSTVIVVDARLFTMLPAQPEAFRERRLFTRDAVGLRSIRYSDPSNGVVLENGAQGWALTDPAVRESDQVAVSMYIQQLKRIEGKSFPANVSAEAFGTPRATLEFEYADGQTPSRIDIGAPVPGSDPIVFYARQDFGQVTTIGFEDFQVIQVTPFDFREKSLVNFDPAQVSRVDLAMEDRRVVLVRDDGRWTVAEPANAAVGAQSDVSDFLKTLAGTQLAGVADPVPSREVSGVGEPILNMLLTIAGVSGERQIGPIRIGNLTTPSARERFVVVDGGSDMGLVDQTLVDSARMCLASIRWTN